MLHQATTKPKNRPSLFPPASAAQRYIDPEDGEAEQASAITAAVMNVKTHVVLGQAIL